MSSRMIRFFTFFMVLFCLFNKTFSQDWSLNWSPGVDENTVALYLFDEPNYMWMTLTDASPNKYDLRLAKNAQILENDGKFGNALQLFGTPGAAAVMACKQDGIYRNRQKRTDYIALYETVYTTAPTPEDFNIGWFDWTLEFWYKAEKTQEERGIVFTLGHVNTLYLDAGNENFIIDRLMFDNELKIPTDKSKLTDGKWHHLAFSYVVKERQTRHFVDGVLQSLPEKGGFLPMKGEPGKLMIGATDDVDRRREMLFGYMDELRLSKVARYLDDFEVPSSFSTNYSENAPAPSKPVGLPLLFEDPNFKGPYNLGARKHVFIDDVILAEQKNVEFVTNVPTKKEITDFKTSKPWDPAPRFNNGLPDINSVFDAGDEIRLYYYNGGFWSGKKSANCIAVSKDGLHWEKPELGNIYWTGTYNGNPETGTLKNNIVWLDATQGTMFKDANPNAPESERYKYLGWAMQRGLYLYTSPDGYRWKRNETIALPFEPGGGVEAYWDDQRGSYTIYLRCEGQLADWENQTDFRNRECALAESDEVTKPWPFKKLDNPKRRHTWDAFTLPSVTFELPIKIPPPDDKGQVYRSRAIKYPGAPDTYVAFAWRYFKEGNIRPGCELMTSRDGRNWKGRGAPYYFKTWEIEGKPKMQEALSLYGMMIRNNEIWQYGETRFTSHAGANYGGNEFEGGIHDFMYRTRQRLDGFVSIDAGSESGSVVTKPIIFEGSKLELNVNSSGSAKVAILNEDMSPIAGFNLDDCRTIKEDEISKTVSWNQGSDLSKLAGKTIRLKFELEDAKLYAFQFVK